MNDEPTPITQDQLIFLNLVSERHFALGGKIAKAFNDRQWDKEHRLRTEQAQAYGMIYGASRFCGLTVDEILIGKHRELPVV